MATTTDPRDTQTADALADHSPPSGAERIPIGTYLARQRELREISLQDLADLTRIPLRSLERLESGQFDENADGFVRGFVRTVASALGLDPDDTIARMLEEPNGPAEFSRPSPLALSRIVALVGIMVVLMITVIAGRAFLGSSLEEPPTPGIERSYRVDSVRALAEANAAAQSRSPVPANTPPPVEEATDATPRDIAKGPGATPQRR